MIETSFVVRFFTDDKDEGVELKNEIKKLLKNSYVRFTIDDFEQEEE